MKIANRVNKFDKQLGDRKLVTARLYLHDSAYCDTVDDSCYFNLKTMIATELLVDFHSIFLAGSAQTGWSISRRSSYDPQKSDLDFAIVNSTLFVAVLSEIVQVCHGYSDNTKFASADHARMFREYASAGIVIPKYMPSCKLRQQFDQLQSKMNAECSSVGKEASIFLYMNEKIFIGKQKGAVNKLREAK